MITPEQRDAIIRAHRQASRVTGVTISMFVPGLLGYAIDRGLETLPWCTLIGSALGFAYGIWRLAMLIGVGDTKNKTIGDDSPSDPPLPHDRP
ncbi:hypothetical protein Mal64_03250 [Pseudobythopirellula maris]|uniref:F0F1-ATPase subunit n=1 Tax=Pseudobythopirellula maris TaxID=2527991 RepID=A0A5C5ZUQ5_9BACT|nr:AtpZ/AtpI family protein [Pseudobythopirellula maris]TWT89943.1 hypothetical protein Mal64_03250 [Pseudobythopirellula maris]